MPINIAFEYICIACAATSRSSSTLSWPNRRLDKQEVLRQRCQEGREGGKREIVPKLAHFYEGWGGGGGGGGGGEDFTQELQRT